MPKRSLPLSRVYQVLEPGPVVLVSTAGPRGPDVMAMSWHCMMEFEPPLVGCVISGRHLTFDLLAASRECVINVPTVEIARAVVGCGNVSGRRVDKFRRYGLTAMPSASVRVPRIEECYANLECRIADARLAQRYNFFVLEIVKAWIDPAVREPRTLHHAGYGTFRVAGDVLRIRSRAK